jgi:hypothetical protein
LTTTPEGNPPAVSIEDDLDVLGEQIEALKQLGQRDSVTDGEVYDFSIRWGTALAGRLARLQHYSSLALLDEADEHNFQSLCAELRGLSDLISRFQLAKPALTQMSTESATRSPKSHGTSSRRWLHRRC